MKFAYVVCLSLVLTAVAVAQNQFVYTNDETAPNTVSAAQIQADGSLTQIAGSPFATGGNGGGGWVEGLAIASAGKNSYLYAENGGDGTISGLKINRIVTASSTIAIPGGWNCGKLCPRRKSQR